MKKEKAAGSKVMEGKVAGEDRGPLEAPMKKEKLERYEIITYPLVTEKAINMIESENKLCFIVNNNASKKDVKEAVEKNYNVKVDSVKVLNDRKGRKKAVVKINEKFKADEIATKLGVL